MSRKTTARLTIALVLIVGGGVTAVATAIGGQVNLAIPHAYGTANADIEAFERIKELNVIVGDCQTFDTELKEAYRELAELGTVGPVSQQAAGMILSSVFDHNPAYDITIVAIESLRKVRGPRAVRGLTSAASNGRFQHGTRVKALNALGDFREPEEVEEVLDGLSPLFDSGWVQGDILQRAIEVVGAIGSANPGAAKVLAPVITRDHALDNRLTAIDTLKVFDTPEGAAAALDTLAPLLNEFTSPAILIQRGLAVVQALGNQAPARAVAALTHLAASVLMDCETRVDVIELLGTFGHGDAQAALSTLQAVAAKPHESDEVREAATLAIAHIQGR